MSRVLKVLSFALAVFAFGAFAASCGSGNAQYRVVNAIPNTTQFFDPNGFAIYMNGTGIWSDVTFTITEPNSNGKYQSVSGGSDTLDVYKQAESGQTGATAVINSALSLGGGIQYTLVLTGNATSAYPVAAQLITDNNPTPTSGDAGVRIIDTSLVLGAVDIYVLPPGTVCDVTTPCPSSAKIASSLVFPANGGSGDINSGYQNVGIPANGSVVIWVTPAGNGADPIYHSTSCCTFNAGQNYTLVFADANGGGSPQQLVFLTP